MRIILQVGGWGTTNDTPNQVKKTSCVNARLTAQSLSKVKSWEGGGGSYGAQQNRGENVIKGSKLTQYATHAHTHMREYCCGEGDGEGRGCCVVNVLIKLIVGRLPVL